MSNEINTQNSLSGPRVKTTDNGSVAKKESPDVTGSEKVNIASGDSLSKSSQLTRLSELSSKLSESPPVDAERVAEIKQALTDGTLTIDAEKIAQSIIDFESS